MARRRDSTGDLFTRMLRQSPGALERYMLLLINAITGDAAANGRKDPLPPDPRSLGRDRRPRRRPFLREMFHGASEVRSSLQQLDTIVVYARSFPYRNKKITKGAHLRYHFEAYIQEVGMLRMRLHAYVRVIERLYKQDEHLPAIKAVGEVIRGSSAETFKWFVDARDGHVHEERFSDLQLTSLSALELIASVYPGTEAGARAIRTFEKEFRAAKKAKVQLMKDWNKSFREHVDMYFQVLIPFVSETDGRLRWPPGAIR
jgi:hypothetical protein